MRFKMISEYWVGVISAAALCVVSLWLAATGQLALYIHPRYIGFTVLLSAIGLVAIFGGVALHRGAARLLQRSSWYGIAAGLLCVLVVGGLLVLRPAVLTSSTATQRGMNTTALDASLADPAILNGADISFEQFSLKEWASVLGQTVDPAFFEGKQATVSGFISPAGDGGTADVFYVSRFVVTCCAVDAQPIGVPVYAPEWRQTYRTDQWVEVRGSFARQPASLSTMTLQPEKITVIAQPEDPYAH